MRKWIYLVLILTLVMTLIAGCTSNNENEANPSETENNQQNTTDTEQSNEADIPENLNLEGYPIVNEPIELTMMGAKAPHHAPWNDMLVFKNYAERTNIKINWDEHPQDGFAERKNLMFASGSELPDAFYAAELTRNDEIVYGVNGDVLIPLNDLIDQYAPTLMGLMEEYPEIRKTITAYDGNIYSLPLILGPGYFTNSNAGLFINKKWLDELNLPIPETTDEFYETLKAFQENYPDAIPMSGTSDNLKYLLHMKQAWGITSTTFGNSRMFDVHDGQVRFIPTSTEYKEVLEYTSKLFNEGLISSEMLTNTVQMYQSEGLTNPIGVITNPPDTANIVPDNWQDYVGLPPLIGPNGDQVTQRSPIVQRTGTFAITKNNPNPEATMRWVDNWYSGDAFIELSYGYEGEHYSFNSDGKWELTKDILNNPDGLSVVEALGRLSPRVGSQIPFSYASVSEFMSNQNSSEQAQAQRKVAEFQTQYLAEETLPSVMNFTAEEQQRAIALQTDIETYVDSMHFKFITGNESFENWDKYISQLEQMGYMELTDLVQTSFDR